MKKLIVLLILFCGFNLFAQDWDEDDGRRDEHSRHEKIKNDYFSIGIYGGGHSSNSLSVTEGPFNSIAAEIEYVKSKKWGFFVKTIYEFTPHTIKDLYLSGNEYLVPFLVDYKNPITFNLLFNFGARYYITQGKVTPYFNAGLSNEASFISEHHYLIKYGEGNYGGISKRNTFDTFLSINLGVGAKIKLSEKFGIDMQYDVYQYIGKNNNHNAGYSAIAGLKYNL